MIDLVKLLGKKFKNDYEKEQNVIGFLSRRIEELHYVGQEVYSLVIEHNLKEAFDWLITEKINFTGHESLTVSAINVAAASQDDYYIKKFIELDKNAVATHKDYLNRTPLGYILYIVGEQNSSAMTDNTVFDKYVPTMKLLVDMGTPLNIILDGIPIMSYILKYRLYNLIKYILETRIDVTGNIRTITLILKMARIHNFESDILVYILKKIPDNMFYKVQLRDLILVNQDLIYYYTTIGFYDIKWLVEFLRLFIPRDLKGFDVVRYFVQYTNQQPETIAKFVVLLYSTNTKLKMEAAQFDIDLLYTQSEYLRLGLQNRIKEFDEMIIKNNLFAYADSNIKDMFIF